MENTKLYPVATSSLIGLLPVWEGDDRPPKWYNRTKFPYKTMAVKTGEYRSPKRGEWYISGAEPEAYQAPNDLPTMEFHIARLVLAKQEIIFTVVDANSVKEAEWKRTRV